MHVISHEMLFQSKICFTCLASHSEMILSTRNLPPPRHLLVDEQFADHQN